MNLVIWLGNIQGGGDLNSLKPAINVLVKLYADINIFGVVASKELKFDKFNAIDKKDLKNLDYDLILFC